MPVDDGRATKRPLILVVEDEWFLQADLMDALGNGGFDADAVFSGEEALELFTSETRPYQMLITDVRLGGSLTGWELATRIREGNDAFPVIYLTASAAEEWASNGVPHGILIGKPFEATELISAISRLLKTGIEPAPVARR